MFHEYLGEPMNFSANLCIDDICELSFFLPCRALVGMMMYNPETNEIAKPSELLSGVRAMMNVLQSIENYGE